MSRDTFKGVNTVVPTPLKEDESVDGAGLHHLIDYYMKGCNQEAYKKEPPFSIASFRQYLKTNQEERIKASARHCTFCRG